VSRNKHQYFGFHPSVIEQRGLTEAFPEMWLSLNLEPCLFSNGPLVLSCGWVAKRHFSPSAPGSFVAVASQMDGKMRTTRSSGKKS
jgi:hypothetical protein